MYNIKLCYNIVDMYTTSITRLCSVRHYYYLCLLKTARSYKRFLFSIIIIIAAMSILLKYIAVYTIIIICIMLFCTRRRMINRGDLTCNSETVDNRNDTFQNVPYVLTYTCTESVLGVQTPLSPHSKSLGFYTVLFAKKKNYKFQ